MEEAVVETPSKGQHAFASTMGLILCVGVAFYFGWLCHTMYVGKQDKDAKAAEAAAMAAAMAARPVTVESAVATLTPLNPPQSFMGHVEPIEATNIRAQVDGTIKQVAFEEGSMVKEGELLFEIEPQVYEARVAQAKAALSKAKAASENADRYYARIIKVDKRAVTEAEIDAAYATMLEARAAIAQCEADLAAAEINLGYTKITAPISGRIGKSDVKKGDYVAPSMGTLARIVQTDPVRIVFSVPDKAYLRGARAIEKTGKVEAIRAQIKLADGSIYPYDGKVDFMSNEMNSATASLPVRYSFANPKQLLLANAYVTVLLSEAEPKAVLTVPANAVMANAAGDYLYVIENNKASRRNVTLGNVQHGLVEILSGLEEGEHVVTEGAVNCNEGSNLRVVNPVKETPVMEAPVAETAPVADAPAVEEASVTDEAIADEPAL